MPTLNRVELLGHLGRDPEARVTANGKPYATFSIAINRTWKTVESEQRQATDWFQVNAWGRLGEICLRYLKQGRLIFLEGRLRAEQWEDKESGTKHSRIIVIATGMQMLDRKFDKAINPDTTQVEVPAREPQLIEEPLLLAV